MCDSGLIIFFLILGIITKFNRSKSEKFKNILLTILNIYMFVLNDIFMLLIFKVQNQQCIQKKLSLHIITNFAHLIQRLRN